ncbi:hypothetical protein ARMSODRAFT_775812 [Armillaria solidipes]|uniref:Uncharacterized protein n=1 Tax=Armillaria solidipes TaxID=1076256 RepID=A0A2H3B915_9AGAR|nr:hypothetical protein ARMSODRAFT_775812 [Armillaria solidipes]
MATETMAQDFCNPYERASHPSRVLLILKVPPSVSLRLHIYDIRRCLPVCFFLDLMVFGAQGRLDSIKFEIVEGCLAHTYRGCVLQESTLSVGTPEGES